MSFSWIENVVILAAFALLCNCATTKSDSSDVPSSQIDILQPSEDDTGEEVFPEETNQEYEGQKNAVRKDGQGEGTLVPVRSLDGQDSDSKDESKSEVAEKREGPPSNESLPTIPDGGDLSGSALDNESLSHLFDSKGKGISDKSEFELEGENQDREFPTSASIEPPPPSDLPEKIYQFASLDKNSRPDPSEKSDSTKVVENSITELSRLPNVKSIGGHKTGKGFDNFSTTEGTPGDGSDDSRILDPKKEKKTKLESVFLETEAQASEKSEQGEAVSAGLPEAGLPLQVSGSGIAVPEDLGSGGHSLITDRRNSTLAHSRNSDNVNRGHSDDNGLSLSFSSLRRKGKTASETSHQRYLHLSDWLTRGPRKDSAEDGFFLGQSDLSDEPELKTYLDESPLVGLAHHVPWRYDAIAELLKTPQEGTSGLDASEQYRYEALRKLFGRDNPLTTADDSSSPPDYENVLRWLESRSGASKNLGSQPQPKRKYSKVLHWLHSEGRRE